MDTIIEGKAKLNVHLGKITKKLPVFYNPEMKLNRDIAVQVINAQDRKLQIADPLAGSGARGIRFLLECPNIESVVFNELNPLAVELIKENLKLNNLSAEVLCKDSDQFLLESCGYDYIDIDPFGSPNFFLDAAAKRISRDGILAVTATDTSALAGSSSNACIRKYWAVPLHSEIMHEVGIRILIRKVQLIAAQYDKALTPIFCHSTLHYMRVYFRCVKGKTKVDTLLKQHGMFQGAGPMWLGRLWDTELVQKIDLGELSIIAEESKLDVIGFYDVHQICKAQKMRAPKMSAIIEAVTKLGHKASQTHFSKYGIKTDMDKEEFVNLLKKLNQ
jgi:tRNA (guanine26-N2/guanine27-N2)-dimethyltransferase